MHSMFNHRYNPPTQNSYETAGGSKRHSRCVRNVSRLRAFCIQIALEYLPRPQLYEAIFPHAFIHCTVHILCVRSSNYEQMMMIVKYGSKSKCQRPQLKSPPLPRTKKARQCKARHCKSKVLLTTFFDVRGIAHHAFLPQRQKM